MRRISVLASAAPGEGGLGGLSRPLGARSPARLYRDGGKRALDLALALLLLPLAAPLIALAWLAVRAGGGPGFYVQERVGRHGRRFRFWKMRTMVVGAEAALAALVAQDPARAREWRETQKLAQDPRVTPLGHLLRVTRLDELPQIWNVIRGEMSFVGPRPFMTCQEEIYRAAGGTAYFALRPGITGPWQVEGRATAFVARVRYDTDYAATLSLAADLRLIARTIGVLCHCTGH